MHVTVTCTGCSRSLRLPSEVIGSSVSCPLCKVVFLTRETDPGKVEAITLEELIPLEPAPAGLLDLSLDLPLEQEQKPVSELPLEEPEILDPIPLVDDLPLRDRKEPERSARHNEEDRSRPRQRSRSDKPQRRRAGAMRFRLYIHHDSGDRLSGVFEAEADELGIRLWRGKGRTLEVPVGADTEYLGKGKLRLDIEGRPVEVTAVHPHGLHDELTRVVEGVVRGLVRTPVLPIRPRGPVVWLALLPLAIPVLALLLGQSISAWLVLAWSALGGSLALVCLAFVLQRDWSASARARVALGLSLAGFGILGLFLASERRSQDSSALKWKPFAPVDGGFRIEMPGVPRSSAMGRLVVPHTLNHSHQVTLADETQFLVGYGDNHANLPGPRLFSDTLNMMSRSVLRLNVLTQRALSLDGNPGVEAILHGPEVKGVVRLYLITPPKVNNVQPTSRLFGILFLSARNPASAPEVRRFLDSFGIDSTTGWPGPATPGGPGQVAFIPPGNPGGGLPLVPPFQQIPPPAPIDLLAPFGKVKLTHATGLAWTGFTPEGSLVVVGDDGVIVRYTREGEELPRRQIPRLPGETTASAALSPDGKRIAILGSTGSLQGVDLEAELQWELAPGRAKIAPGCLAFLPDGTLAEVHGDREIRLWDPARRKLLRKIPLEIDRPATVAVAADGKRLIVGDVARNVEVLDMATGKRTARITDHELGISALAIASDGRTYASASSDRSIRLRDLAVSATTARFTCDRPVSAVAFYPSGRLLVAGTDKGRVVVVNLAGNSRGDVRQTMFARPPTPDRIRSLSFSPDGKQLALVAGSRLEVWQIEDKLGILAEERQPLPRMPFNLARIEVGRAWGDQGNMTAHPDGSLFAVVGADNRLQLIDPVTFTGRGKRSTRSISPLAFQPGTRVLAIGEGPTVVLHHYLTEVDLFRLSSTTWMPVTALGFAPDGKTLAAGYGSSAGQQPSQVSLWNLEKQKEILKLKGPPGSVNALEFLPDGKTLALVGPGQKPFVYLYDLQSGTEFARLRSDGDGLYGLAISPDGKFLATGSPQGRGRIFDLARMQQAFVLEAHPNHVAHVAFTPDGKTLATGGGDGQVMLHDVASGKKLHVLRHNAGVFGLGFGPAGKTLLVRTADGRLSRWDLDAIDELKKRPDPVAPDFTKTPPPEASELRPAAQIVPPLSLVFAPEQGCALVMTRDRMILRYSLPDWKLTHTAWLGAIATSAVLDPAKGLLYAATTDPRKLREPFPGIQAGEGDLLIWDVRSMLAGKEVPAKLKPTATIETASTLYDLCLSLDGKSIFAVGSTTRQPVPRVQRIDLTAGKLLDPLELTGILPRLARSGDGKQIYAITRTKEAPHHCLLSVIDSLTGKVERELSLEAPGLQVKAGKQGVVVSGASQVLLVKPAEGKIARWAGNGVAVVGWPLPDDRKLLILRRLGDIGIEVHDLADKGTTPLAQIDDVQGAFQTAENWMSPDGQFLVGAGGAVLRVGGGKVERPKPAGPAGGGEAPMGPAGRRVRELDPWLEGHAARILAVAVSPDGRTVATGGDDKQLLLRSLDAGQVEGKPTLQRPAMGIHAIAFAPDGSQVVSASLSGQLHSYRIPGYTFETNWRGLAPAGVDIVAYLADGSYIVGAGERGLMPAPATRRTLPGLRGIRAIESPPLTGVVSHPARFLVAAGGLDGKVRLFDLVASKEQVALTRHTEEVRAVAFSPDGKWLASTGVDGCLRLIEIPGEKELHKLEILKGGIGLSLACAPDGKVLAVGGLDGSIHLVDVVAGKEIEVIPPQLNAPTYALAFAPDGKTLWAACGMRLRRFDTSAVVGPPVARPPLEKVTPPQPPRPTPPTLPDIVLPQTARVMPVRLPPGVDVVTDPKTGDLICAGRLGTLSSHDLKAKNPRKLVLTDRYLFRVLLDSRRDRLICLRTATVLKSTTRATAVPATLVTVPLEEYRKTKEQGKSGRVETTQRLECDGKVSDAKVDPEEKYLYYLDVEGKQLCRVDLDKFVSAGAVKLDDIPRALALSPDGKALLVAVGEKESRIVRIDRDKMTADAGTAVKLAVTDLAVSDRGVVFVSGTRDSEQAILRGTAGKFDELARGTTPWSIRLSPDQRWLFASHQQAATLQVQVFSADAASKAAPREFTVRSFTSRPGDFVFHGDATLLYPGGMAVPVPAEVLK